MFGAHKDCGRETEFNGTPPLKRERCKKAFAAIECRNGIFGD